MLQFVVVNNVGISYDHPEYYADIDDEKVGACILI